MGFTSVLVFAAHQQLPHILEKETPHSVTAYLQSFSLFLYLNVFFVTYLLIVFWGTGRREMLLPGNCLLLVQMSRCIEVFRKCSKFSGTEVCELADP